jgi:hypothetical protein
MFAQILAAAFERNFVFYNSKSVPDGIAAFTLALEDVRGRIAVPYQSGISYRDCSHRTAGTGTAPEIERT